MRPKSVIILDALLSGNEVTIGHNVYVLSDDYKLCAKCINFEGEDILVKLDFGNYRLSNFIKWCESATETEMFAIVANKTLNDVNIRT